MLVLVSEAGQAQSASGRSELEKSPRPCGERRTESIRLVVSLVLHMSSSLELESSAIGQWNMSSPRCNAFQTFSYLVGSLALGLKNVEKYITCASPQQALEELIPLRLFFTPV